MAPRRAHTEAELEAAIQAISEPGRLDEAQRIVQTTAPALQRMLNAALEAADWFGPAHNQAVGEAAGVESPADRLAAVRTLLADETRVSMLIGVAVGYELAHELDRTEDQET
jgi:hypothetical protein